MKRHARMRIGAAICLAINGSIAFTGNVDDNASSVMLSLYSNGIAVTAGRNCPLVIEVDNSGVGDLTVDGPIAQQGFNDVTSYAKLPNSDPAPDSGVMGGYTLAITSYMAASTQLLRVTDHPYHLKTIVSSGSPFLIKAEVTGALIGQGINRVRVTLFKAGKAIAVSNAVVVEGLAGTTTPMTQESSINMGMPSRHLPPDLMSVQTSQPAQ
jgi:hypothetical protein